MCDHLSVSSAAEPNPHFWTFDINPLSFSASAEANADGEGAGAAGSPANPCCMKAVPEWQGAAAVLAAPASRYHGTADILRASSYSVKKCLGQTPSFVEIWHDRLLRHWPVLPPISPQRG